MRQMDSKQIIAISILSAKEGKELPEFSVLETDVCKLIISLIEGFDYFQSNEFLAKTEGKSQKYKDKLVQSLSEPRKANEIKEQFFQSIREIEINDNVLNYISNDRVSLIHKIKALLSNVSS